MSSENGRVRVISWIVRPQAVFDDGGELEMLSVQEQVIPASAWEDFKNGGDKFALAEMEAQIISQRGLKQVD